jgi:hypothetical protein
MYKKNSVWVGLLGGLALPSLAFLFVDFIKSNLSPYVRVDLLYIGCVALNLILVNLAYKYHKEETAKGVISATFICAFIFFYYKYTS